ncbi:Chaperonin-like rbcx protein 1 protein [Thalictrum thalictroides]|uniref:Chaperonin-like rbcx protein 1 protein n=1 Tax=Thalictrum thalictroides TaxID=46969 RepID=A0A7J6VBQ7_THATH|nr:Chaperonin-like rbcx protein 1 protein [Thalictrum thalictroides]
MPKPCKQRSSQPSRIHCNKMFVPGFGEASPESKAAKNLNGFFTYVAVKIVLAQLEIKVLHRHGRFHPKEVPVRTLVPVPLLSLYATTYNRLLKCVMA